MTKQLEALIKSEIADFFAGVVEIHTELGGPNTVEEAQQQLTERVLRIAGLEASQLAVKLPSLKQTESGERYVWSDGVYNYQQDVIEAIRAAGGKVQGDE